MPPVSRTYWRSLAQIEDSAEFRDALEREFPAGASELPEGVTRRDMMMLLGASLSLAGIAGCRRPVEEIVPFVTAPEEMVPGIPRRYATTMPFRRSAYGLIVESHEGRPTKIEGNPSHPSTLGASSSLVQASVLGLYDPDRSQSVTLQGKRKSWSDFATAWGQLAEAHGADGGSGLAILSESFCSPTLARLASELRSRYPRVQWATYDAVSDENRLEGVRQATGRGLDLMLRLDRAAVILALDADPLLTDPEMIRHARGFATGRNAGASGGAMNRLYAIEGVYSLTGAMADHRLRLESRQIAPFLAALAARLGLPTAGAAGVAGAVPGVDARWIDALAKDLLANRGKGLIVAGERQPAAVHAAVCALNTSSRQHGQDGQLLRDEGRVASEREIARLARRRDEQGHRSDARRPGRQSGVRCPRRPRLRRGNGEGASVDRAWTHGRRDIRQGKVAHPARSLPRVVGRCARGWRHAQRRPAAHPSPVRWTIPGRSAGADGRRARIVPATTSCARPGTRSWARRDFDTKWNRVLHDGFLSGSELPEVVPSLTAEPLAGLASLVGGAGTTRAEAGSPGGLEIVFLPSPSLHDGRFANDGWLQELPDPLTKLTWDNPALVSPKTAETLGLASEDVVRIDHSGRALELPVSILPGMADGVVAVTVGYGRSHAGRIGSGVGFNAFSVRSSKAPGFDSNVRLTKLARTYPLSATQNHGSMEGRPIVRESTVTELRSELAARPTTAEPAHAGNPHEPRRIENTPAQAASSRKNRNTSRSGRRMRTTRGTSGG